MATLRLWPLSPYALRPPASPPRTRCRRQFALLLEWIAAARPEFPRGGGGACGLLVLVTSVPFTRNTGSRAYIGRCLSVCVARVHACARA